MASRSIGRFLESTLALVLTLSAGVRTGAAEALEGKGPEPTAPRRPNIVFFLADDLGWVDTAVYGSRFHETPNIDRLAGRGMRFTNAYAANPLCSPTRASILSGQYPARLRITTPAGHIRAEVLDPVLPDRARPDQKAIAPQTRNRLPLEIRTLAEVLKDAGYATAHLGKWHLGWEPYHPGNQGFDFVLPGGSYPGPPGGYFAPFAAPILEDSPPGEQIDERLAAEAVRWIEDHKGGPFFLNFWFFDVHAPHGTTPELAAKYRAKADPESPQRNPIYGGMVETMDGCVGRVVDALDRLGLADRTIVVFTSDNGGISWQEVEGAPVTSNLPLRNGKASIHEGGTREPAIVVWPGRVEPGSRNDAIVSSIDYYPTLLEMVGLAPEAGQVVDGVSLVPTLTGTGPVSREALFCHFPHYTPASGNRPSTWVRRGDWKLIRFYADGPDQADRFELYNLAEDIGETRNLAADHPALVRELDSLIDGHLEATDALVPIPNPAYRPPAGIAGWSGNAEAELTVEGRTLLIQSTGGDPSLSADDIPSRRGPLTLEIQMRSGAEGKGQVFWTSADDRRFHGDRSVSFAIEHDDAWHTYKVALPVEAAIQSLRLDPGTAPGAIRIESLRLKDARSMTFKEWRFEG